jgi:hypothetical protein
MANRPSVRPSRCWGFPARSETTASILITSRREAVWVILLILIFCVFRDADSAGECSGVHETSITNLLETRMNTG